MITDIRAVIAAKLEAGLSAQRIYQDLVGEHAFTGSYYSVRRMVRRLSGPVSLPFRRMRCGFNGAAAREPRKPPAS